MRANGWTRKWKDDAPTRSHASPLLRAAAQGDSLEQILALGAQALLGAGAGNRAGIWLAGELPGEPSWGRVAEVGRGSAPEQWKRLDISTPFLRTALDSPGPLHIAMGTGDSMTSVGPLVGMRSVTWIPLRERNRTIGLAMVAHARARSNPDIDTLGTLVDEIALVVRLRRSTRLSEAAAEALRAQLRLSRAILCGVSAESILPQIARAARQHVRAEFVALAGTAGTQALAEGWDGPEEWRAWAHDEPIQQLWRKALEEGQESDLSGEAIPGELIRVAETSLSSLDRLIVIPMEIRSRTVGALMAGFQSSEDGNDDYARLESYSLLAASALDREAAREERSASRRSFRQILEDSGECLVVIDAYGTVREASHAAAALLAPSRMRLEELPLEDFFSPAAREKVAQWRHRLTLPDSERALEGEHHLAPLEAALLHGAVLRLHFRSAISGLGSGSDLSGSAMWLIQLEDQEQRRAFHEAQGRLEAEMAGLLDSIESGVLILDSAGHIRIASDRLGTIMGIDPRHILELGTVEALMDTLAPHFSRPVETMERWRQHLARIDEASWDEFELIRPARKMVERFSRPINNSEGMRLGWLEVHRDITAQRLIQSKLLQTEKMAALGQLVSGIAHELNNPLTSIQGYAQLLQSHGSGSDRAGNVRHISQEAERAARIVKNLLLFSRETKPERRAVELNEVIERTLALRSYELKIEDIAVELMLDPGLPHTLADAAQLQQAILNLIVNAEQAILQARGEEDRPGSIHIRTRRISGDRIAMEVSDNGPGIPPEVVSRIFDPFFTTKPAGMGTGLGLSIVYGIVQEHGGEVSVESQPGHGAKLTIELPALSAAAFDFTGDDRIAPAGPVPVDTLDPARLRTRSERILVVEDEPTVAQLIADVLAEEGHRADTVLDSREALGHLEKRRYGLVICDLKMPHLDGPGLYRALVSSHSPMQHKLMFVTGDTMSPRTLDFLKSSGLPYLAKPFLVEELKQVVRQAFAAMPVGSISPVGKGRLRAVAREK